MSQARMADCPACLAEGCSRCGGTGRLPVEPSPVDGMSVPKGFGRDDVAIARARSAMERCRMFRDRLEARSRQWAAEVCGDRGHPSEDDDLWNALRAAFWCGGDWARAYRDDPEF